MKGTMKKTLMILLAFVLVFALALSACGKKKDEKKDEEAVTTAEETTTAATEEATEEAGGGGGEETAYGDVVAELVERYNTLIFVDAGGLDADDSTTYSDGVHQYRKVTDPAFQSFGDINNYLLDTFTTASASYHFPSLFDPTIDEVSVYVYVNDGSAPEGLYELMAGRGIYPYEFLGMSDVSVESDTIFNATASVRYMGEETSLFLSCVKEDGVWKISDVERPE